MRIELEHEIFDVIWAVVYRGDVANDCAVWKSAHETQNLQRGHKLTMEESATLHRCSSKHRGDLHQSFDIIVRVENGKFVRED